MHHTCIKHIEHNKNLVPACNMGWLQTCYMMVAHDASIVANMLHDGCTWLQTCFMMVAHDALMAANMLHGGCKWYQAVLLFQQ